MSGRMAQWVREVELPVDPCLWAGLTALADPVRLRILLLLRQREQCVCHLTDALHLSQSTISHHVAVLKRAGLVRDRRDATDGRWTYYALDEASSAALRVSIQALLDTSGTDHTPALCADRPA